MTAGEGNSGRRRQMPAGGRLAFFEAADGARLRYARWPPPAKGGEAAGTVLFLNGRREFIEKHFETIADLQDRGFAVVAPDWRGQGGSARSLGDRQKGHIDDFATYVDDLARFIDRVFRPAVQRPALLLAHSMGAHIALRYLHRERGLFERAVLLAPLVRIYCAGLSDGLLMPLAGAAASLGLGPSWAPFQHPFDDRDRRFAGNPLSGDAARFADEAWQVDRNPALALGGVTYGWARAALRSERRLTAPGYAEAITTPIQIVMAGADRVVDNPAIRRLAARLPDCRLDIIEGARHEILKERDCLRNRFWAMLDQFIG